VLKVASYLNLDSFALSLKDGYDSVLGERGSSLSAGQRQLISFARAMVYDPSILVLDEATSNLDSETERLVQDALEKLVKNRTTIIIAHRLSTIKHAHSILVMHQGKVFEQGNHASLIAKKSLYYDLYRMQFDAGEDPSSMDKI
jgi:ATP-binding cassette, subfamily B, multidrug efflux pump